MLSKSDGLGQGRTYPSQNECSQNRGPRQLEKLSWRFRMFYEMDALGHGCSYPGQHVDTPKNEPS